MSTFALLAAMVNAAPSCQVKADMKAFEAYCSSYLGDEKMCKAFSMYCDWKEGHPDPNPTPAPPVPTAGPKPAPQPHPTAAPTTSTTSAEGPVPSPGEVVDLSNYNFQPCVIQTDGNDYADVDKADHFANYPDPFAFYTNNKEEDHGVTLVGPSRQKTCGWVQGENFTWTADEEQCILNGGYWNFPSTNGATAHGSTGNPMVMSVDNLKKWNAAINQFVKVRIADEADPVDMAIGYGHGVLKCRPGDVALVRNLQRDGTTYHYAAILMVGTRAWSYEISPPASHHLAQDNNGGTCYIPDVAQMTREDALKVIAAFE